METTSDVEEIAKKIENSKEKRKMLYQEKYSLEKKIKDKSKEIIKAKRKLKRKLKVSDDEKKLHEQYYSVKEYADIMKISVGTVYYSINHNILVAEKDIKIGKTVFSGYYIDKKKVRQSDIYRYVLSIPVNDVTCYWLMTKKQAAEKKKVPIWRIDEWIEKGYLRTVEKKNKIQIVDDERFEKIIIL